MRALLLLLVACSPTFEEHVTDVCKEAGQTGSDAPYPCNMTKGQLRQWISDEDQNVIPKWRSLVFDADTVTKLTRLWKCRHYPDGHSWSEYGWNAPGCAENFDAHCKHGKCASAFEPIKSEQGQDFCDELGERHYRSLTLVGYGFIHDANYDDCPEF